MISSDDLTAAVDIIRELHPKASVRRQAPTGIETDHDLCTWCMVEWPCPTISALDDLLVSDAG